MSQKIDLKLAQKRDRILFGGNREIAIQRDGEKCVKCGMTRAEHREKFGYDITVDHIDGRGSMTPAPLKNNDLSNLQTLCISCHARKDLGRRLPMSEWPEESRNNTLANIGHGSPRRTHCFKGHLFTPENTYVDSVRRKCRTCNLAKQREWRQTHKRQRKYAPQDDRFGNNIEGEP